MFLMPINSPNDTFNKIKFTSLRKKDNQLPKVSSEPIKDTFELSRKKVDNKSQIAFMGLNESNASNNIEVSVSKEGKMAMTIAKMNIEARKYTEDANQLAKKVLKEASEVYQKIEKSAQEVYDLYNRIQQGDYDGTAILTGKFLEEFDEDDNLIRVSVFENGELTSIEEINGIKTNAIMFADGEPLLYSKGQEDFARGIFRKDSLMFFEDGQLSSYTVGISRDANGIQHEDKSLYFNTDKKYNYDEDCTIYKDGSRTTKFSVFVVDGKPISYYKNMHKLVDGSTKVDYHLKLQNGKPNVLSTSLLFEDTKVNIEECFELSNGKWQEKKAPAPSTTKDTSEVLTEKEIDELVKEIDELSPKALKKAYTIYQTMIDKAEEVMKVLEYAQSCDVNSDETIKLENNILEEYDEEGNLIRKTKFNCQVDDYASNIVLEYIEEYNGKTKNFLEFRNGEPYAYGKDYKELADGSSETGSVCVYLYGKIISYTKGIQQLADGSSKIDFLLFFKDDKPKKYIKGQETSADGIEKIKANVEFKDGKWQETEN